MLISLSEIMNLPRGDNEFTYKYEPDVLCITGKEYEITKKDDILITVTNKGNKKLRIKVKVFFEFLVPCDRCLSLQKVSVPIDFAGDVDMNLTSEERALELDDTEYISGYDLDVDRLIYEEILLGFPMKVLCSEDCKGLCKICGHNLNVGECGCDRIESDPRMSVIRDIFKTK